MLLSVSVGCYVCGSFHQYPYIQVIQLLLIIFLMMKIFELCHCSVSVYPVLSPLVWRTVQQSTGILHVDCTTWPSDHLHCFSLCVKASQGPVEKSDRVKSLQHQGDYNRAYVGSSRGVIVESFRGLPFQLNILQFKTKIIFIYLRINKSHFYIIAGVNNQRQDDAYI